MANPSGGSSPSPESPQRNPGCGPQVFGRAAASFRGWCAPASDAFPFLQCYSVGKPKNTMCRVSQHVYPPAWGDG